MSRKAVDTEYLSDVWTRINSVFAEQKVAKCKVAKKCGFDRKTLIAQRNISITYFARLCEELNVSADFFCLAWRKIKRRLMRLHIYQINVIRICLHRKRLSKKPKN